MSVTLVKDPEKNWMEMEGDTEPIKRINAILTSRGVSIGEAPHDECIIEAQIVEALINRHPPELVTDILATYFHTQFGWTPTEPVDPERWKEVIDDCFAAVKGVSR
jgi:hypothetical protein